MSKINLALSFGLVAVVFTLITILFVADVKSEQNRGIQQLQRLNNNLEKLNYERNPVGLEMLFPARVDQKFTA